MNSLHRYKRPACSPQLIPIAGFAWSENKENRDKYNTNDISAALVHEKKRNALRCHKTLGQVCVV